MASPSTPQRSKDSLTDWPRELKNVKEICKVLGVLGYQCPFIPNFAHFTRPLTNLLKKDTPFEWTPKCCASLDTLIDTVSSPYHPS
jgi:hypothetical protein